MSDGVVGAVIGAVVALIGVAVAAGVAVFQIKKQARMGLKVALYREVLTAIEVQGDAERDLSVKLTGLNALIEVWLRADEFGEVRPNPSTSWGELHDLRYKAGGEGAQLMCLIEKWQIVDPRLDVFRLAFGSALFDMTQTWAPLSNLLGSVVPVFPTAPVPQQPPNEKLVSVMSASKEFQNALSKLSAWVADFQLEMQCLLLSDLFNNRPPHRHPPDPQFFVVRLDRHAELTDYFLNHTAWGQAMNASEERAKAAVVMRTAADPTKRPHKSSPQTVSLRP